jgi:PhoPQ-activated pathogenicity-related protein
VVRSNQEPDHVVVWQAASPTRDFRKATWSSTPAVVAGAAEADRWRATIQRPATGFSAVFVECQYARAPVPLMLTTSVSVQPSA